MPLSRHTVTAASRVMLKIYPPFATIVGLSFVITPRRRLMDSPSLRFLDGLVPLNLLGWGFLLVASGMLFALLRHERRTYQLALGVMIVWMFAYTVATVASAFYGQASFSAGAWPAFVCAACWATLLSLETRET
jgi:hypothetical protein